MPESCYRHPNRETGVSCSSCGRPICPECMTPTPVGMRCPECSQERTRVTRGPVSAGSGAVTATYALIAINVAAFLFEIAGGSGGLSAVGNTVVFDFGLRGEAVAGGEWYRLITGGFLHANLIHLGFNMFVLYVLGRMLEPALGTPRFVALYFASLFAGDLGALLLSDPWTTTVGASGAVFGLFGAAFLIARSRGLGAIASELGLVLLINLGLTFAISNISVGGHLGGLAGGLLCAMVIIAGDRGSFGAQRVQVEVATMATLAVVAAGLAIVIA